MYKILLTLFILFGFTGCFKDSNSGQVNNTTTEPTDQSKSTNDEYISSIPDDTTPNTSVAQVPHNKSSIPMLVILVNYTNQEIVSSDTTWSNKIFGMNNKQLNHYYHEASHGNFTFAKATESAGTANDGIISVTLAQEHPDYNINLIGFDNVVYPGLKAALEAADPYIDYSIYDEDADGAIQPDELLFTFIIAGYEDAYQGHVTNGIWAHQYCTSATHTPTLDGIKLMGCADNGNFALFGERHDTDNPHDATIGIIAHELGHSAFNLPDLYNTSGSSGGIGYFGLMGAGTWTQASYSEEAGETPVHFSAWSKVYNGWITPEESTGSVTLDATSSSSYNVIKIPISANNYYLLENRDNAGYDQGFFSLTGNFDGGMAIWHVNENKLTVSRFESNNVNSSTSNKGVDLVEAVKGNIDSGYGGSEKALFYYGNVVAFGDKVTNISARSSQMTLNISED